MARVFAEIPPEWRHQAELLARPVGLAG